MTRSEIRTLAKRRADMENSRFVSDAEWNVYMARAHAKLYDILISRFEDDFTTASSNQTVSGSNTISLPANFYKLRGLDYQVDGSKWADVPPFMFAERNTYGRTSNRLRGPRGISYRLVGQTIRLVPETGADGVYRYWFIPRVTLMTADTDSPSGIYDFHEYIAVEAARMALAKEESDTTMVVAELAALEMRIQSLASNRNAAEPERISDTSGVHAIEDSFFPL